MSSGPAEFEALVNSRKSIRVFSDAPLELELVDRLLSTASQAPSAHNRQPWRFAVLSDPDARDKLARSMGDKLRTDRLADGDDAADIEKDVERSWKRITGAPIAGWIFDRYQQQKRAFEKKQQKKPGPPSKIIQSPANENYNPAVNQILREMQDDD